MRAVRAGEDGIRLAPRVLSVSGPALSEDECVAPGTHMAVAGSRQKLEPRHLCLQVRRRAGGQGRRINAGRDRLVNKGQPRKLDDWGPLRVWAWRVSRALDYLETDKSVDAKHVGLEGPHGMAGSSVAMAYDPRFAIAYVSVRPRRNQAFPAQLRRADWQCSRNQRVSLDGWQLPKMCRTVTVNDLPVDAHELIARCAPHPVFVGTGATNGDGRVDAKGMLLAEVDAGSVYKLSGRAIWEPASFLPSRRP